MITMITIKWFVCRGLLTNYSHRQILLAMQVSCCSVIHVSTRSDLICWSIMKWLIRPGRCWNFTQKSLEFLVVIYLNSIVNFTGTKSRCFPQIWFSYYTRLVGCRGISWICTCALSRSITTGKLYLWVRPITNNSFNIPQNSAMTVWKKIILIFVLIYRTQFWF